MKAVSSTAAIHSFYLGRIGLDEKERVNLKFAELDELIHARSTETRLAIEFTAQYTNRWLAELVNKYYMQSRSLV